jgi:hypothetical protein
VGFTQNLRLAKSFPQTQFSAQDKHIELAVIEELDWVTNTPTKRATLII